MNFAGEGQKADGEGPCRAWDAVREERLVKRV